MITHEEIDARFAPHPPTSEIRQAEHAQVCNVLRNAAHVLLNITSPGRDQVLMVDHLEDAMTRANCALAMTPDPNATGTDARFGQEGLPSSAQGRPFAHGGPGPLPLTGNNVGGRA